MTIVGEEQWETAISHFPNGRPRTPAEIVDYKRSKTWFCKREKCEESRRDYHGLRGLRVV